jgi:AcrR family transcriptional regulator
VNPPAATPSPRRRPKGNKRERTRAKILKAAVQVIWEKGYERATVQEIARRAGMSNGAVYGNFKDRDDLFASIGPNYWPRVRVRAMPGSSLADIMNSVAEATIAAIAARSRAGPDRLSGLAYALKHEALRARAEENAVKGYAAAVAWWRSVIDVKQLPMPPEVWVRILGAMIEGLTFQRLLTPELIPDEVIFAAFAAMASSRSTADRPRPRVRTRPAIPET